MNLEEKILIVLDIDGTLISENSPNAKPILENVHHRPYLKELLEFLFINFSVAIWTAAGTEWSDIVLSTIGIEKESFLFVWNSDKCKLKHSCHNYGEFYTIKPLEKIWNKKQLKFTKHNTILIDNTPSCFEKNTGNGLLVPTFVSNIYTQTDDTFLKLIEHLKEILTQFKNGKSVRNIQKWGFQINLIE